VFSVALMASSLAVLIWQFVNLEPGLDMPWMPARLLGQGIDPYGAYLDPLATSSQFLAQIPNMLHSTYVLFTPFGFLSWEWAKSVYALINLSLAVLVLLRIRAIFKLENAEFLFLATLFILSIPFRVTIYNGQFSLVALLGVLLFLERVTIARSIGLGVALLKYSFAFPIAFLVLLNKDMRKYILYIVLPAFSGMVVFHLMFQGIKDYSFISMVIAPLLVALVGTGIGASDLYSLFRSVLPEASSLILVGVLVAIAAIGLVVAIWIRRINLWSQISLICLVSLTILPHLIYDYVFLLPIVALAVVDRSENLKWFVAPTILWHWFLFGPFQTLSALAAIPETVSIVIGLVLNTIAAFGLLIHSNTDSEVRTDFSKPSQ
jgi:hypothetical protein